MSTPSLDGRAFTVVEIDGEGEASSAATFHYVESDDPGQLLPAGALATGLRNIAYFDGAQAMSWLAVLLGWAVAAGVLALLSRPRGGRARDAAVGAAAARTPRCARPARSSAGDAPRPGPRRAAERHPPRNEGREGRLGGARVEGRQAPPGHQMSGGSTRRAPYQAAVAQSSSSEHRRRGRCNQCLVPRAGVAPAGGPPSHAA